MEAETHEQRELWLERILQLLHDPPGKVKYLQRHKLLSRELAEAITGLAWTEEEWKQALVNRPDATMAGADRPCLSWSTRQHFNNAERQLVTHPLSRVEDVPPLLLSDSMAPPPVGKESSVEERQQQREAAKRLLASELASAGDYEAAYYRVWRRFRHELVDLGSQSGASSDEIEGIARELFWSAIPADTRCPDVSIWDHTRASAALSFMNVATPTKRKPTKLPKEREPWLLQVSLSGVQSFVDTARTSRDLWVGSFLFADLAFHAMLPIIEAYGATAILYPDLRGNPRMDAWLAGVDERSDADRTRKQSWRALPDDPELTSFAALVPNSFVAVVPLGGADGMPALRDLANESRERVGTRWKRHAGDVESWLGGVKPNDRHWKTIWERQHAASDLINVRWTAVPWVHTPKIDKFVQSGALPFQDRTQLSGESPEDQLNRLERMDRLGRWVPEEQWAHNERTRYSFSRINETILQMERGFDYAATNAQLRAVHQMRKQAASWSTLATGEGGVKCSLCALRSALTSRSGKSEHIDSLTNEARRFWSDSKLDPEGRGAERLCAICATKRFLITAGGSHGGINPLWANDDDRSAIEAEGEARVPFPSTTAIAAQGYIAVMCRSQDRQVLDSVEAVVRTHQTLGWPRTQFPRCLRQLNELYDELPSGDVRREFLMREPQELLYPDAMEARVRMLGIGSSGGSAHVDAIRKLLSIAKERLNLGEPSSRLAVIKVDGDSLGSLLTGAPGRLRARWRDVLHPELVDKLSKRELPKADEWKPLLDSERSMGPSLHAFVTRALAEFAHRLAPWVVEQEFDGRLIYAGGDDLLALAPAHQALPIAARLQQLLSAVWLVDTAPERDAWSWRRNTPSDRLSRDQARQRFVIPVGTPGEKRLQLPAVCAEPHVGEWAGRHFEPVRVPQRRGPVIPMLGRGQSLSAGIVYAHFKDPLGALVRDAQELVDGEAKQLPDKRAVALAWRTRGGEKMRCVLPWNSSALLGAQRSSGDCRYGPVRALSRATKAFSNGELSKDLPFTLRDRGALGVVLCDRKRHEPEALREALGRLAGDGLRADLAHDVVALWREGLLRNTEAPERAADGLAIARALSAELPNGEVET